MVNETTNKDQDTPLHYAAQLGHEQIAELLISNGASLNAQNYQGYTLLHWAASKGHQKVSQIGTINRRYSHEKNSNFIGNHWSGIKAYFFTNQVG